MSDAVNVADVGVKGAATAVDEFKQGVQLLRDGHAADALVIFRRAADREKQNPYYLSFLGLTIARTERKWAAAVELCETALRMKRNELQLHLNLAEVYSSAGRREDAIETLDKAQTAFGRSRRITRARGEFGKRRSPVFSFLPREAFLNRTLGKLRHRIF